jgi:hypothetical protein
LLARRRYPANSPVAVLQDFLLFETAGDSHDVLVGTRVALLGEFPPGSGGAATTLLPVLGDVVFVRYQGADLLAKRLPIFRNPLTRARTGQQRDQAPPYDASS